MIPVVMLAVNISALSSLFLTLFCPAMTCPSEHLLVIYLMTVTAKAVQFYSKDLQMHYTLSRMLNITQFTHLAFSLLINISATFIIALKAWYVRVDGVGKTFINCALLDTRLHTGNTASC